MYIRKRIGRKRSFYRKHKALLFLLLCAGAGLYAAVYANRILNTAVAPLPAGNAPENLRGLEQYFLQAKHERIVYPYSIIPGGVRSREEMATNMSRDRVVADHFSGFNLSRAKMIKANETRFLYVSYRLKNKVYWTAKKVKIPEGETLISDGECEARARCGNRVSAAPMTPVSDEEPMVETFDFPEVARLDPPLLASGPELGFDIEPAPPIPPLNLVLSTPRSSILPYYYRPLFVVRSPDTSVPETGTLALVLTGLAAFGIARFSRKK